jgi:hypothetical protein
MSISVMPAPGRWQSPGITERVDSHGLVTFGVEGEARLLYNSPIGAAVADGPSKPSLHHNGGSGALKASLTRSKSGTLRDSWLSADSPVWLS